MPDKVDTVLMRLANAPVPPGLAMCGELVLARVGRQAAHQGLTKPLRIGAIAAIVALFMGIVGSGFLERPIQTQVTLSPFGPTNPLLLSTLLADS